MHLFMTLLLLGIGIVLVVKGGDLFVDAAAWIAEVSGIPKLIIGATVVSFATTLPELLVSSFAAVDGKVDMAIGNAVGSVTANQGLILAIALIFMPAAIRRRDYLFKAGLMIGAAAVLVLFGSGGSLTLGPSILLFAIFALAMGENVRGALISMRSGHGDEEETPEKPDSKTITVNIVKFLLGIVGIVLGADFMVDYGSELARILGVPEQIIAVTIIAIGTSLPELVTTLTAIAKKQHALSAGNIIGANIIDLTMILPVCAFLSGGSLPVPPQSAVVDIPFCLLISCLAMLPALILKKFTRIQGLVMLVIYIVYVILTCTGAIAVA